MTFTYADAIVGSQRVHARKEADFYPTPANVTVALLEFLKLPKHNTIWEPACGDGAMSRVLLQYGYKVLSSDLREDSGYGKGGVNFQTAEGTADWIITNPPFNLAEIFIRKSLTITPNVAMLLKSQYWHAATRLPLFQANPPEWVLPLTWRPSFLEKERGNSPLMDVIWVVWSSSYNGPTKFQPIKRPIIAVTSQVSTDLTELLS